MQEGGSGDRRGFARLDERERGRGVPEQAFDAADQIAPDRLMTEIDPALGHAVQRL
jgi:hypothetical protein